MKMKKQCGTCRGFGLWAIGDPMPMGQMDANDGMPTKPCPECGANPNSYDFLRPKKRGRKVKKE